MKTKPNWRLLNLCCFSWYSPLLTSEQVTHKETKASQSQVLVSVKCRREAGGKEPCWQNAQVSALCRGLSQQWWARSRALSPGFRAPQLSFLPRIDLANHHSVALWHSSCKRGFISLEPGSWHSPQNSTWAGGRGPQSTRGVLQLCCPSPHPLQVWMPMQRLLGSHFAGMPGGTRGQSQCWVSDSSCALGLCKGNSGCFSLVLKRTPS